MVSNAPFILFKCIYLSKRLTHRPPEILTHDYMDNVEGEDVDGQQGERKGEKVEEAVVPLAHTVSNPGTVVVKAVWRRKGKAEDGD